MTKEEIEKFYGDYELEVSSITFDGKWIYVKFDIMSVDGGIHIPNELEVVHITVNNFFKQKLTVCFKEKKK